MIDCPQRAPPPISFVRLSRFTMVGGSRVEVLSLVVSVRLLLVLGSFWRFLTFSRNFAFESKARQKYCEKGAPYGVVGSCPRITWPTSSWYVALTICKLVAGYASKIKQTCCKNQLKFINKSSQNDTNDALDCSKSCLIAYAHSVPLP